MNRRYYIDYLKAFGCVAITALHVITNRLDHTAATEMNYYILSGLLVLTRWAVPVFVMVSGCNLLGRDGEVRLVKKHSVKMLVFALIWGVIYLVADPLINIIIGKPVDETMLSLTNLFQGTAYHLWFCFTIVGLYLLIPLLNKIVTNKGYCQYLIIMCLASTMLLPALKILGGYVPVFRTVAEHFRFPEFGIYVCYFVMGYYIDRHLDVSAVKKYIIYFAAVTSVIIMIAYGFTNAMKYQVHKAITAPEDLTAFIFSIGVYLFFKLNFKKGKCYPLAALLAKHSFGIYVMHSYLIIRLSWKGLHATMCNPFVAVPLVTAIVVAVSLAASCILRKIPRVGKWIV